MRGAAHVPELELLESHHAGVLPAQVVGGGTAQRPEADHGHVERLHEVPPPVPDLTRTAMSKQLSTAEYLADAIAGFSDAALVVGMGRNLQPGRLPVL